jgi:hypothetical protein
MFESTLRLGGIARNSHIHNSRVIYKALFKPKILDDMTMVQIYQQLAYSFDRMYESSLALVALASDNLRTFNLFDRNQLRFALGHAQSQVDPTVSSSTNKLTANPFDGGYW